MDLGLRGKKALVTGGSHGIGRAIALALAEEGCEVGICARGESRVREVVAEIEARGVRGFGAMGDITDYSTARRVWEEVVRAMGDIDILVNNIGGGGRWGGLEFEKEEESLWRAVYEKNALVAVRFTTWAIPGMLKKRWGRVVSISSTGSERAWFNMAKAAEDSLMSSLARGERLVRTGITFNSVAPGPIMIPGTGWEKEKNANPVAFGLTLERFVQGRLGTPEEVASVVVFLCSKGASWVNGARIVVDGGGRVWQ